MTSYKRWVKRGFDGTLMKWEEEGQEIEGIWRGTRTGRFGDLGTVETTGGRETFPIHTALAFLIEGLKDGDEVKIIYTGKIKNPGTGREFKSFELFVAQESDSDDPGVTDADIDSLPF